MATSNNPLAPNPVTDIDGPEVFPPVEPQEGPGESLPEGEAGNVQTDIGNGAPANEPV